MIRKLTMVNVNVFKPIIFSVFIASCNLSWGYDESVLWLPKSYAKYYIRLQEAAQVAEDVEPCTKVLKGTLDFDQSTDSHPIFRILCLRGDGLTYNEMVDGNSLEALTTPKPDLEAIRLAEEKEIQKKLEEQWITCLSALKEKVKLMKDVNIHSNGVPPFTETADNSKRFIIDFDAFDMKNNLLEYRAKCDVDETYTTFITVKPRKFSK